MSNDNVDSILSQDLLNINSYSDEHTKQLIEIIIKFIIDTKVSQITTKKRRKLFYFIFF